MGNTVKIVGPGVGGRHGEGGVKDASRFLAWVAKGKVIPPEPGTQQDSQAWGGRVR